jgi:hypothetical protein
MSVLDSDLIIKEPSAGVRGNEMEEVEVPLETEDDEGKKKCQNDDERFELVRKISEQYATSEYDSQDQAWATIVAGCLSTLREAGMLCRDTVISMSKAQKRVGSLLQRLTNVPF